MIRIERTISAMIGKGSTRHNSRQFIADNIDRTRTPLNIEYRNEAIEDVYRQLFGEALARYNDRQTRDDRKIDDYYTKIRTGKQEKPFHEVIFQIGNHLDTASDSEEGELARKALDEYYRGFIERNRMLRVFSAHLHMDEATPHLHIDFIPYTIGSRRGLDTRVSLKQALASLGFVSGGKQDTEWNQWIESEKSQLAAVMLRYGIDRYGKGEHREHLSVLNYKREERAKEVAVLSDKIDELQKGKEALDSDIEAKSKEVADIGKRLSELAGANERINLSRAYYDTADEWQLPEPTAFMSIRKYIHDLVEPFVMKLKGLIGKLIGQIEYLTQDCERAYRDRDYYRKQMSYLWEQNEKLKEDTEILDTVCRELGDEKVNEIIACAEARHENAFEVTVHHPRNGLNL